MKFRYSSNFENLILWLKRLDPTKVWEVSVREWKSKRSIEQNRWIRGYADKLGKHIGYEADEMYDILMYKFNPQFITIEGEVVRIPGHFSQLKTNEAADVQDAVQRWGNELGFNWEGV